MDDEVVTHAAALEGLPPDVRHELLMALPPHQRGWWTQEEADADGGQFIEVTTLSSQHPRFWRIRSDT